MTFHLQLFKVWLAIKGGHVAWEGNKGQVQVSLVPATLSHA